MLPRKYNVHYDDHTTNCVCITQICGYRVWVVNWWLFHLAFACSHFQVDSVRFYLVCTLKSERFLRENGNRTKFYWVLVASFHSVQVFYPCFLCHSLSSPAASYSSHFQYSEFIFILQIYCVFLLYEAFQMQKFLELLYLNRDGQKNEAFQSIRISNPKHTKIRKASTEYKSLITFYTTRYLSHISQSEAENLLAVRLQIFHIPSVSYHMMGEKHAARRSTERTNGQVNICFDHAK